MTGKVCYLLIAQSFKRRPNRLRTTIGLICVYRYVKEILGSENNYSSDFSQVMELSMIAVEMGLRLL